MAWLLVIGVVFWLVAGGGWATVTGWFGWGNTYDDRLAALTDYMTGKRIGESGDVWMVKTNFFGEADRVALFFGYLDDWAACHDFISAYRSRYPSDKYSCSLAN